MTTPTFVRPDSMHPISANTLRTRDPLAGLTPVHPSPREGSPEYEPLAAGVADLQSMFAKSLTDEEKAWANGEIPSTVDRPEPAPAPAPLKFKNAYHVIIDAMLIDPTVTITRLATLTGYSRTWLHKVMGSDSFQAQLASRQKNCVDDHIRATVTDRLAGLGSRALEILETALDSDKTPAQFALDVLNMTNKAQGIGQQKIQNTQNFIVQVPVPMTSATDWAKQHAPITQATVGSTLSDSDRSTIHTIMAPTVAEPLDMGAADVVSVDEETGKGATDE